MKPILKNILPHIIAIVIFLVLAVVYCSPTLEGKVVNQDDNIGWRGMVQQSMEYKDKYGNMPLWTNNMFGGMPTYQIATKVPPLNFVDVVFDYLYNIVQLGLPKPINFLFLACVCFYILLQVCRINPWLSIIGAIAYAYSSYDPIIIAVGHDTKMLAIANAPAVVAGFMLLYKKKYLVGAMMLGLFLTWELRSNHYQIVYYTLLIVGILTLAMLWHCYKNKDYAHAIKSLLIATAMFGVSLSVNAVSIFTTYDYTQATMRGAVSELKNARDNNTTTGGLDKDYAFSWSQGIFETFSLIDPSVYGGGNGGRQFTSSKFAEQVVDKLGYPEEEALRFANGRAYWGEQPFTSGPVYLGAIVCFLFIIGMFVIKSNIKWWLFAVSVLAILLAWGKHFQTFNYFLFDYLPYYKKFRAPSMALVIPQLTFCLVASMALQSILFEQWERAALLQKIKKGIFLTAGILLILLLAYGAVNFTNSTDANLKNQFADAYLKQAARNGEVTEQVQQAAGSFGQSFVKALQEDRKALYISDWFRTLILIALAGTLIVLYLHNKIKTNAVIIGILVLSVFDLIGVDKRYFGENEFVDATEYEATFKMTPADIAIKKDTGYYRVFNTTRDTYNDSYTSYFHNSIGGYSPAKISLFQDIIEYQLTKNNIQVFNMLNMKYIIMNDQQTHEPVAQNNPDAFGAAWLVKGIKWVTNGKEEMEALNTTILRDTAVVQVKEKNKFNNAVIATVDTAAKISLVKNYNDSIVYTYNATTPVFAVFSEVYYDRGWHAYIDNQPKQYCKVNYVLRGMALPTGSHVVSFRFEPKSFLIGSYVQLMSHLILYSILIGGAIVLYKRCKKTSVLK